MHLRNSRVLLLVFSLLLCGAECWGQAAPAQNPPANTPAQPSSTPPQQQNPPAASPPAAGSQQQSPPANPPAQPPAPGAEPQNAPPDQGAQPQGQAPSGGTGSVFVFKKEVEEVVLHATVVDNKQHMVMNLDRNAFQVFENGKPQVISSFRREDIPVAMGIVIDNSGSMREKRDKVNKAALNLVRASNSQDQVFVVNFNDEYYLDQDFTSSIAKLKEALEKVETRGGTALYDALVASAAQLKTSKLQKKVLFVVTDGEDNASRETLEEAVKRLQEEDGPTVYAIGLLGDEGARRARRALQTLADRTGGIAFLPKTLDEVDEISSTVAHDIRSQYTIGYKPTTPKSLGGFRTIRVEAHAHGYGKLTVRTRSGYYAGQAGSAGAGN
jgi:VWFA-related protein